MWPLLNSPDSFVTNHSPCPNLKEKKEKNKNKNKGGSGDGGVGFHSTFDKLCSLASWHLQKLFPQARARFFHQVSIHGFSSGSLLCPSLNWAGKCFPSSWFFLPLNLFSCILIEFPASVPPLDNRSESRGNVSLNHHSPGP